MRWFLFFTRGMIPMTTVQEARQDAVLGRLGDLAKKYKIPNAYVTYNNEAYFICGFKPTDVMFGSNKLDSILSSNNKELMADYNIAIFKLDKDAPEANYNAVLEYCKNIDFLRPIYENKYINSLDKAIAPLGLFGTYVIFERDLNSTYSGVYFVFGLDKNAVFNPDIDIRKLIAAKKDNDEFFNYKLQCFELTNNDPFIAHQEILEFSKNAQLIQQIYQEYNQPMPDKITMDGFEAMKMLYLNSKDDYFSLKEREAYEKTLRECLEIERSMHGKQRHSKYSEINDRIQSKSRMFSGGPKMRKGSNRVDLETVFSESPSSISQFNINIKIASEVQRELDQRTDILYWMSPVMGQNTEFEKGHGFAMGRNETVDTRFVRLAVSDIYDNDIYKIINQLSFPEGCRTTAEEMSKRGDILFTKIPPKSFDLFNYFCNEYNVEFCIDNDLNFQNSLALNIAYFKKDEAIISEIMGHVTEYSEMPYVSQEIDDYNH